MVFKTHIFSCTNQRAPGHSSGCCASKGADALRDYMKHRLKELGIAGTRVNKAGCLDRCQHGPCFVIYPEGVWYSPKNKTDIDQIIEQHIIGGTVVKALEIA